MKTISDNEIIETSRGRKRIGSLFDENAMLHATNSDMMEMLYRLLPIVEDAKADPCYKPGYVAKLERDLLALIKKVKVTT
jgi:hypothetical protein